MFSSVRVTKIVTDDPDRQILEAKDEMGEGRLCIIKVIKNNGFQCGCLANEINWFQTTYPPNIR